MKALLGANGGEAAALLRARARALAAPGQAAPAPAGAEMVVFVCGGERYALAAPGVHRVLAGVAPVRLAGCPDFIAGIVAVDGEVVAAVDLRILLALPLTRLAAAEQLLVLRAGDRECGILAEAVIGVERIDPTALAPSQCAAAVGVAADGTTVLDAAALLHDPALNGNFA